MRIIPVMDLLGGRVVHAKKGERKKYQPVKSVLCATSDPAGVAKALYREFKFRELYMVDLDAIQGRDVATDDITRISISTPMKLMVDAGVDSPKSARIVKDAGAAKVIVATETLKSTKTLEQIVQKMGSSQIISSLDVKFGVVLSKSPRLRKLSPAKVATILEETGVSELIVLELTRVGSELGVDRTLVESVIRSVGIPVITGGGIRNAKDLTELKGIGVSGALVATSLHTGSITPRDVYSLIH